MPFTAVVRITGAGRLADFRERLRWLLVRDPDAEDYTEHHRADALEYRFMPKKGIPFPAFAQASGDFPELRVEAEWSRDGVQGRAVIENGQVVNQERGERSVAGVAVTLGDEGRLELAFICEPYQEGWIGYAASAIERDRLLDEVTARNRLLETIREMLQTLAGPVPTEAALRIALQVLRGGLSADEVALVATVDGALVCRGYSSTAADWLDGAGHPAGTARVPGDPEPPDRQMPAGTLAAVSALLVAGSLRLTDVVWKQTGYFVLFDTVKIPSWNIFSPAMWISAVVFIVSGFAETNRLPFDFAEADSELVAGYHTEYSSMKFALFFMSEYMAMTTMSALIVTIFFGGWSIPYYVPPPTFLGFLLTALVFVAKVSFMLFVFVWIRWTIPRLKYDILMKIGWKMFLPLALVNLVIVALFIAKGWI